MGEMEINRPILHYLVRRAVLLYAFFIAHKHEPKSRTVSPEKNHEREDAASNYWIVLIS